MAAYLAFHDLTLGYDRHPAIHHLDGKVAEGTLLGIAGPNGSGKSTLLKAISGRIQPLGGRIENTFRSIAYLPQGGDMMRDFPIAALDFTLTGLCQQRGFFGRIARGDRARAEQALAKVGLAGFEDRSIRTLSGGQAQRLLFARLMMQDAPLILLDEPFLAVDSRTIEDLLAIVTTMHRQGRTILIVLHDLEMMRAHIPLTMLLARELIAWGETSPTLSADNLARARTMAEAFDRNAPLCERVA
jgi:zinc/manganese transport system ATP-binding protein